jgi:non-heme chloroperoxidase
MAAYPLQASKFIRFFAQPRSLLSLGLFPFAMTLAIAFGGPSKPQPVDSINQPFRNINTSDLPPIKTYRSWDSSELAYRHYTAIGKPQGSVTLIHGSSASSTSMHSLAKALAAAGYEVFALDMRGHGQSGERGHIGYVGQLETDLAAFVHHVQPSKPASLVGFSSGGGFVLRVAGSVYQTLFQHYVFLAPFISQDAPNQKRNSGGWASVGLPRIIALSIANSLGIRAFNSLPVIGFGLNGQAQQLLTPFYDFNLATNFRPQSDYQLNLQLASKACAVIAGDSDELFFSEHLAPMVKAANQTWPVQILPGLGHIDMLLHKSAHEALIRQLGRF